MEKHSTKDTPKQLSLLPPETVLGELDSRVRRVVIHGEEWVSVFDILEYHGNKKNPRQAWKTTIEFMERQGADLSCPDYGQHQFEGKGQRKTPIINLEGFMRFVQSAEVPEWEFIREWIAKTGANEVKSKATRKLESEIAKYDKAGLGNRPEIVLIKARLENKVGHELLKEIVTILCEKPNWRDLNNAMYMALFGMVASELHKILNTSKSQSIRDKLPLRQLQFLTLSEGILTDTLSVQGNITMQRILDTIDMAIVPIGNSLQWYSQNVGLHHVTGQSLLKADNNE